MRECNTCFQTKEKSEFYVYQKYSKSKGDYLYFNPRCKKCASELAYKWGQENDDKRRKSFKKYNHSKKGKESVKKYGKKYREDGRYREWQDNNRDRVNNYNKIRKELKTHDISQEELNELYFFANYSCMYCGMPEEESIKKYNQKLHRDHAIVDGSNGIENCILACKSCNSSKRENDWFDWYTTEQEIFNLERLYKIESWLNKFVLQ